MLQQALAGRAPGRVLDVGCGDGLFFDALSQFGEVEGVELDASIVDPRGPHAARIYLQPFDEQFLPGNRYSLILMLDVLEHLADPQAALRHAHELLDDDGLLLITVPAFNALWTAHDDWNHHRTRYTKRTFRQLATAAGLELSEARYFFHWTCPVKLAMRLKESLATSKPRPARVPPRWLNRSLQAMSLLEQHTLGRLPMPFGSSLLTLVHKSNTALRDDESCRTAQGVH